MRPLALAALTLSFAVAAGGAAYAVDGLFSGKRPVAVAADHVAANEANHSLDYTGRVELTQGDQRVRADHVVVFTAAGGGGGSGPLGAMQRMEANGNVFFVTPTQVIRGDQAVYEASTRTLVVTGQVILVRGDDVMTGTHLTVHLADNSAAFDAGSGRVRTVVNPKQAASAPAT